MIRLQSFFNAHKRGHTILLTILLALALVSRLTHLQWLTTGLLVAAGLLGVLPLLLAAVAALRFKMVTIDLLVSIATLSALAIGEPDEAAIVCWLFAVGDLLETASLAKTRQAIKDLAALAPQTGRRLASPTATQAELVPVDQLTPGDLVQVLAGDQVPVDGEIVRGRGFLNEANLTGESRPVAKQAGTAVLAGTHLTSGTLVVEATRVGEDSTFGKLIELVEEAQDSQTRAQRLIDRFAQYYTPAVLVLALLLGLITRNFRLAITVLVLGCPGALVIGVPASTVAGIGQAARAGIMARGSAALETLTKVDAFVFDKTGTLTSGRPSVTTVVNLAGDRNDNLALLTSLERESQHPLAQAIRAAFPAGSLPVTENAVIDGQGIRAIVAGHQLLVGNQRLLKTAGVSLPAKLDLPTTGSRVFMAVDGQARLALAIADQLRPTTAAALTSLRQGRRQPELIMLSGDNQATVDAVAATLPLTAAYGDLLPAEKVAVIKQLQRAGKTVAFVGDGLNDSPALAQADLGIAMGSGAAVSVDVADLILIDSDLAKLVLATRSARRLMNNMAQNIAIALLTVLGLFIGLFAGWVYLASGMFIHEASILVVILNSLRLLHNHR